MPTNYSIRFHIRIYLIINTLTLQNNRKDSVGCYLRLAVAREMRIPHKHQCVPVLNLWRCPFVFETGLTLSTQTYTHTFFWVCGVNAFSNFGRVSGLQRYRERERMRSGNELQFGYITSRYLQYLHSPKINWWIKVTCGSKTLP